MVNPNDPAFSEAWRDKPDAQSGASLEYEEVRSIIVGAFVFLSAFLGFFIGRYEFPYITHRGGNGGSASAEGKGNIVIGGVGGSGGNGVVRTEKDAIP